MYVYISRLTVVSREAKKQQAHALQDHADTTVSNLHAQQLSLNFLIVVKASRKLLLRYYRPSAFLLGRFTTVRME